MRGMANMDDDVSIDLTDEILPHGSPMLTSAIKRVLSVVKALPGAGCRVGGRPKLSRDAAPASLIGGLQAGRSER